MPAARNHYQILNVSPDAEPVVIEAAYRALMKRYHPDQAVSGSHPPGPSAAEINLAFATLRDPGRRAEYDRREWTKGQNMALAAYRPPPPQRLSRAFGWGGWVVAMVLGGVLALITSQANDAVLARAAAARAATPAEPDLRSQPTLPDDPFVSPAALAGIPVDAVPVEQAATPPKLRTPEPRAQQKAGSGKPQPVQPRPRQARTAREKDFLEREGYIY